MLSQYHYVLTACLSILINAAPVTQSADAHHRSYSWAGGSDWAKIIEASRSTPKLRRWFFELISAAETALAKGPSNWIRPQSMIELSISQRPTNADRLGANAELQALARADCDQVQFLQKEGELMAVAARYSGREDLLRRCEEILEATLTHIPLQRPGYTLQSATDVLPVGGDGVWLATSGGIAGIVRIVDVLGDQLPPALVAKLRKFVGVELDRIKRDWEESRPWFVKVNAYQSNQWIELSVALVQGSLFLGRDEFGPHYELGIRNLQLTLNRLGKDGAWPEGISYAVQTAGRLLYAVTLARDNKDDRLDGSTYSLHAWEWFLHMRMPGNMLVNCSDSILSRVPDWFVRTPFPALATAAIASKDSRALGLVKSFCPDGGPDPWGIEYEYAIANVPEIAVDEFPTYAFFQSQQLVCWRSDWVKEDAIGIWVKGGSPIELHGHRDQGSVCMYVGDNPILLDCGRPEYGASDYSKYSGACGHSVLQPGAQADLSHACLATVTVKELTAATGHVLIEAGNCYQEGTQWLREITWTQVGILDVNDCIVLPTPFSGELLRFHTGSHLPLNVSGNGKVWKASWPGAEVTVEASTPIVLSQLFWPDRVEEPWSHAVLTISVVEPTASVSIQSRVKVTPLPKLPNSPVIAPRTP